MAACPPKTPTTEAYPFQSPHLSLNTAAARSLVTNTACIRSLALESVHFVDRWERRGGTTCDKASFPVTTGLRGGGNLTWASD